MIAARIPQSHDTWEVAAVSCRRSRQGFLALMLVLVYYVRSPEASKEPKRGSLVDDLPTLQNPIRDSAFPPDEAIADMFHEL